MTIFALTLNNISNDGASDLYYFDSHQTLDRSIDITWSNKEVKPHWTGNLLMLGTKYIGRLDVINSPLIHTKPTHL